MTASLKPVLVLSKMATALKPAFASSIMLADFIAAQAGNPEAVFDATVSALYTAYYHILQSGNKTQFTLVDVACKQYAETKACKEALGVKTLTAGVKRFHSVYMAYGAALATVGVPSVMKQATPGKEGKDAAHILWDQAAGELALEFATLVTVALTPDVKTPKTDEEKATAKAEKEAKAKDIAEVEANAIAEKVRTEAEKLANASVVTLADMVRIVANAIKTGMVSAEELTVLDAALDAVATTVQYVGVPSAEDVAFYAESDRLVAQAALAANA